MANHVLKFWRDPEADMRQIRSYLRAGGMLAVGYQLRVTSSALTGTREPREISMPPGAVADGENLLGAYHHLIADIGNDSLVVELQGAAGYSG
jgi:hypothetical protein